MVHSLPLDQSQWRRSVPYLSHVLLPSEKSHELRPDVQKGLVCPNRTVVNPPLDAKLFGSHFAKFLNLQKAHGFIPPHVNDSDHELSYNLCIGLIISERVPLGGSDGSLISYCDFIVN